MVLGPAVKAAFAVGIVVCCGAIVWEWRRARGTRALAPEQYRRRVAVAALFAIDFALWLAADTVFALGGRRAYLGPKVGYLLVATLILFLPIYLAYREMLYLARQYAEWHKEVARAMLRGERERDDDARAR